MDRRTFATIGEAYLHSIEKFPNKIAFRHKVRGEWKNLSFKDHYKTVSRLSLGLIELGLEKGERAAILANTSFAWSCFDIAILGCEGITIPIYPTSNVDDMEYILNHSESKYVFIDEFKNLQKILQKEKKIKSLKGIVVNFEYPEKEIDSNIPIYTWGKLSALGEACLKKRGGEFEQHLSAAKPEDMFTICYTSGTTGTPKGAVLRHSCMSSVMEDCKIVMKGNADDNEVLLSFLPMSHILGKWESMSPYYLGWALAFAESIDALAANMQEVRPTMMVAVPRIFEKAYAAITKTVEQGSYTKKAIFQWALCVGRKHLDKTNRGSSISPVLAFQYQLADRLVFKKIKARFGGKLKFCISGGAPLPKHIGEFMHTVGVPVFEGYGLTETCAPICVNMPGKNKFGSVGKLFPEVLVKIADDGEILIKSKKVFHGYYKDEEASKAAFKGEWFATGDIGELDEDGYLKITDRKKDLIKTSGGKYIAPQKIEDLLKSSPYINQVLLYGDGKAYLTALLTLHQETMIQYAHQNKIIFGDYSELVKKSEILALVQSSLEQLNKKLGKWETIKKFHVVAKEFSIESGDLTPSMKLKRRQLIQKYKAQLDALY